MHDLYVYSKIYTVTTLKILQIKKEAANLYEYKYDYKCVKQQVTDQTFIILVKYGKKFWIC